MAARLAEWGGNHGLGVVVLSLEKLQYQLHPPATGGTPPPGLLQNPTGTRPIASRDTRSRSSHARGLALRPPLASFATPALPREGVWRTLVQVHGQPAVQAAFLRPDRVHTSYLTRVVWMSSKLLRFGLHPGFDRPGGHWPVPD